jgi:hypothetical protein
VGGDTVFTAAKDGITSVIPVDSGTAGTWNALIAGETDVEEIRAAGTL